MAWKNVQYENGKYKTSEGGGGGGSSTFAGLDDVSFDNLQNGQVPKYNSDTHKWENADESGGGGTVTDVTVDGVSVVNPQTGVAEIEMPTPPSVPSELSDLSDVQFSNLTDHQPLRYNATSQKWENGADNYPPLIYSDEEREVGVWRDGKPLYQKTYSVNLTINIGVWADTGIPKGDIDRIVRTEINDANNSYGYASASIDHSNVWICPSLSNQKIITLLYTKSTDTAGSGTWTTQGGYAHHYDNVEKVIGTFFGKPLYERSWDLGADVSLPNDHWTSLGIPNDGTIDLITANYGTSEWGIIRAISTSSKVDANYIVSMSTRIGTEVVRYITLQYTKTTDV